MLHPACPHQFSQLLAAFPAAVSQRTAFHNHTRQLGTCYGYKAKTNPAALHSLTILPIAGKPVSFIYPVYQL